MPQFLPHPHAALEHLILAIEEHVETVATSPLGSGPGTSQQLPSIQSTLVSSSFGSSNKVPFPSFSPPSPMRSSSGKLGFSFAFALAENEAISEAVDTLSDIIETCKDLYGVASFIQQDEVDNMGDNVASYLHTPVRTPTRSARQSFSDTQRSPASPTRSIRLSMSPRTGMRVGQ